MPSQTRYAAPMYLMMLNSSAEVAMIAEMPTIAIKV